MVSLYSVFATSIHHNRSSLNVCFKENAGVFNRAVNMALCGKIDHNRTSGTILNLKINDTVLSTPADELLLADLISTYLVDMEGTHVQFNIIDNEKLRDAQKHPEKYRDLIVRLWGVSAHFIDLPKNLQDEMIARFDG